MNTEQHDDHYIKLTNVATNLASLNDERPEVADAVIKLTNVADAIAAHPSRGVVDEDIRWCEDIAASLQEAGGPTNNMRLIALHRLIESAQAAALPAVPEGYVLVRRDSIERAAQMAEVFDDGSDGADAETAAQVAHDLRGWLIAA